MSESARTQSAPSIRPANIAALERFDTLPAAAMVRVPVVAALHGISEDTVWRWVRLGLLPEPVRKGRVTSWRVGDLRVALAGKPASPSPEQAAA